MAPTYCLNLNNETLYGRGKELTTIKCAFKRANTGSSEVILVEGDWGNGKASLVQRSMLGETCYSGIGKFDEGDGNLSIAEFASTLTDLICGICHEDRNALENMTKIIHTRLAPSEIKVLSRFIPGFHENFCGDAESDSTSTSTNIRQWEDRKGNVTKRNFAVRNFLRVLTSSSLCFLIICLGGIEFADDETMELIDFIANDPEQERFVMILMYNSMRMRDNHPLHEFRTRTEDPSRINSMNVLTKITIENLLLEDIDHFISDVTQVHDGTTTKLAELVLARTNGNVFFVKQLLEHLQSERLIYFDYSRFRWTWDLDKVRCTPLSDHVVGIVSSKIQKHSNDVQRVLLLSALLGHKVDPSVLEVVKGAMPGPPLNIRENLDLCVKERLLERLSDGRVKFLHIKIQEAALSLIPHTKEYEKIHVRIGALLWSYIDGLSRGPTKAADRLLFLCADQLSMGRPHISDSEMKLQVAQLNNLVGQKATDVSAFGTAAEYFQRGINLLDEIGHKWSMHPKLSMQMLVSYAEVQYFVGNFNESLMAVTEVFAHEPDTTSNIRVQLTRLHILKAEGKLSEFVDLALAFLEELGEKLPRDPSNFQASLAHLKLMKTLGGMSDDDILDLRRTSTIAMRVLDTMFLPLETLGMKNLMSIAICRAVKLSLLNGIDRLSPQVFALFGVYLVAEKQDLVEGYRYGELALKLAKKVNPDAMDPRVVFWVYQCTKPWQLVPLSRSVDNMFQGHIAAMKQGDPFTAFMCANAYFGLCYYSSLDLRPLLKDVEELSAQMLQYRQKMVFLQILPIWQCILNLSGLSDDPLDMTKGKALDQRYTIGNDNSIGEPACWSFLMQIAFYMGDLTLASDMSAKLRACDIGIMKSHFLYPARVFFFALIAIANARSTGKRQYKQEAVKHMLIMRQWVQKRAANYVHKLLIIEAEFETLESKDGDNMRNMYGNAIATATKLGFMQDAALAAQLAGKLFSNMDDYQHYSDQFIRRAHLLWKSWGAIAVARKLKQSHPDVLDTRQNSSFDVEGRGNLVSRERFDRDVFLEHQRRLSEDEI